MRQGSFTAALRMGSQLDFPPMPSLFCSLSWPCSSMPWEVDFFTSIRAAAAVMQHPCLNTPLLMSQLVMDHHLLKNMDPQVSKLTIVCMINEITRYFPNSNLYFVRLRKRLHETASKSQCPWGGKTQSSSLSLQKFKVEWNIFFNGPSN